MAARMDVLLGAQWGDEGKGKVVDVIAPRYEVIARFQGGPNAGHTLLFEGHKHVLHTIPSGVFRQGTVNLVGNGVVAILLSLLMSIVQVGDHSALPYADAVDAVFRAAIEPPRADTGP